ncbi:MAG TPA: AMP-binding protein [Pyrinomonadaceae bacterium]|nr:AMP-binding protein [Pyrinomonadaceae bacterium]
MHDINTLEDQPIAWTPTPDVLENARLTQFMRQIGVATWDELYAHSINDVEMFTAEVLQFLDINFDPPYDKLLDVSGGIEFPKWCENGGLNITTMCLDRWIDSIGDDPAIIWEGEEGGTVTLSYEELLANVDWCVEKLCDLDIHKGDAVGIHLPMIPETVVSLLAINRLGAIAVPVFSGYGIDAITSRMEAVGAKALITCDGFPRRGKPFDMLTVAARSVANCPTLKGVMLVERNTWTGEVPEETPTDHVDARERRRRKFERYEYLRNDVFSGRQIVQWNVTKDVNAEPSTPEKTLAEDPLIILYTSGTTGKPKGIAHTHASFPIKAAQDMAFGTDVGVGTRISWYTDIGWMMGPWLIYGALINGGTICIYDGAPDFPAADRMWEFCARHKVEILGISPTLIRALSNCGDELPAKHDLSSLRAFASTGEPWNPAPWWWLFEKVGNSKLPIINYSGGTEIAGGILMGNPLLPIKPCSFPAPCPGMDVDILDEDGTPVEPGKVGELVIKQPWIGMARGFWGEKERYLDTYWRRFKDIWVHGDWAMRDADGHWFILGRSDDTLKVAGKRVGPAEVESILVSHPQVTEAAVIGVPDEAKGTAMVAFVVGARTSVPSSPQSGEGLASELRALVATQMGKPLAPSKIHFVSALPKTRNAKVMRRVIRSAYLGEDPGDLSALENPAVVEEIQEARG